MHEIILEKLVCTRKFCIGAINSCAHTQGMSIHKRIRERRIALGLTSHKALAELLGVAWQTVQLWEKEGGTAPNRKRMEDVARALQTTPEWLLHGAPEGTASDANAPKRNTSPPARMQWISDEEYQLLSLYRTTDDEGREKIMDTAEAMPRVLLPFVVSNQS